MTEIRGRVALVTGGGSGIGRGLAMALAAEGASVAVADIRMDGANAVADEIEARGGDAIGVVCDVSDRASVHRMKAQVEAALGKVSLLFANAGATQFDRMTEMSEDDVDWILSGQLDGRFQLHDGLPSRHDRRPRRPCRRDRVHGGPASRLDPLSRALLGSEVGGDRHDAQPASRSGGMRRGGHGPVPGRRDHRDAEFSELPARAVRRTER